MSGSPIEEYLDGLFGHVRSAPPRDARSLLAEAETHLREAADEGERTGLSRRDAELVAIERFGDGGVVARNDRDRRRAGLVISICVSTWTLGALGAIAVGTSGVIAGVMRLAGASNQFIAGDPPTSALTPGACTRWLSNNPQVGSCMRAAAADWAWDTVALRIVFGVLGLLAFAAVTFARRHWSILRWASLPQMVVDTIATVGFAASGVWLAGMGIDALIVQSSHGAGQWLSAAPVALAASIYFGVPFAKRIQSFSSIA